MSETLDKEAMYMLSFIANHQKSSQYKIYNAVRAQLEENAKKEQKRTRRHPLDQKKLTFSKITVLRKIHIWKSKGFVRVEKGPRNADLSWLTLKGLIYAIQCGAIEPKDALIVEKKHNLEVPCEPYRGECWRTYHGPGPDCIMVKHFKDKHPEVFFKLLSLMPNIMSADEWEMPMFCCLSSILGNAYLFITDKQFRDQSYENGLDLGCLGIEEPDLGTASALSPIAEVMLRILGVELPKGWDSSIQREAYELHQEEETKKSTVH